MMTILIVRMHVISDQNTDRKTRRVVAFNRLLRRK